MTDYIEFDSQILNVGCGNSSKRKNNLFAELSWDMYTEGYENILNVDWSEVCIKYMKDKFQGVEGVNPKTFRCTQPLITPRRGR